jgi:hypothetical protein
MFLDVLEFGLTFTFGCFGCLTSIFFYFYIDKLRFTFKLKINIRMFIYFKI